MIKQSRRRKARYAGRCVYAACDIAVGDPIVYAEEGWHCQSCADARNIDTSPSRSPSEHLTKTDNSALAAFLGDHTTTAKPF